MRTRSLRASSGSSLTRSRNAWRSISSASTGPAARAVALRVAPFEHAHLADELARAHRAEHDGVSADLAQDIDAAREDLNRHVARIALPEQGLARLEPPAHAALPPRVSTCPADEITQRTPVSEIAPRRQP